MTNIYVVVVKYIKFTLREKAEMILQPKAAVKLKPNINALSLVLLSCAVFYPFLSFKVANNTLCKSSSFIKHTVKMKIPVEQFL